MSPERRIHTSTFLIGDPDHGFHHKPEEKNQAYTFRLAFVDENMQLNERMISFIPGKTYRLHLEHGTCIVVGNSRATHAVDDIEGTLEIGDLDGSPTYCFSKVVAACSETGTTIHFQPEEQVFIYPAASDRLELVHQD